ncbi:hypothetical protein OCU04_008034 [Sclerotinia nivalis]|uniref:Dienelactone hydrolase domain-containing protein n=1 Tax=Sclerotinia nivalis TaxID=352851 RepID=A0A9X0DIE3_9HELO|nr:hypothetical protein OCU04_008034 [Sclerotinia nivalis]
MPKRRHPCHIQQMQYHCLKRTDDFHSVRPVSSDAELKGDTVYIAEPTNANIKRNQGLIYFSDSSGIAPNNRALADEYARAGYLTIVINYWGRHQKIGRTQDEIEPWDGRDPKSEPSLDRRSCMVTNALDYLRDNRGVGYCAGAPPLMALLLQKPCPIQAAFIASPVRVRSQAYIKAPLSLAQSWDDRIVTVAQRHEQERELVNLASLNEKEKELLKSGELLPPAPWQMNLFSGVEHGFATKLLDRSRMTRDEIYAKRAAFNQSVMWFEAYMPVGGKKLSTTLYSWRMRYTLFHNARLRFLLQACSFFYKSSIFFKQFSESTISRT